eukprot:13434364-Alexandrium_andersonii.AAC.1
MMKVTCGMMSHALREVDSARCIQVIVIDGPCAYDPEGWERGCRCRGRLVRWKVGVVLWS